jgi:hypothetical protein
MLAIEPVVVLGGEERTIPVHTHRRAQEWRKLLEETFPSIICILKSGQIGMENGLEAACNLFLSLPDASIDLLCAWDPAINKEWVAENCTDVEIMSAVWEVVQLAYPFASLIRILQSRLHSFSAVSQRPEK